MDSTVSQNRRQSNEQAQYAGTELLIRAEDDLQNYNRWIVASMLAKLPRPFRPDMRALDFGAGIGTLARLFETKTGVRPDGIELDPTQRRMLEERGFRAFASLAGAPRGYDFIFTSNVLEHIDDDVTALKDLRQHLGENATLAIYVPAFESLWTSLDDRVGHFRRYRRADLGQKLQRAGYRVRSLRYCDSLGFILTLLFKLVGDKEGNPSSISLRIFDRFLLPLSRMADVLFSRLFGKNLLAIAEVDSGHAD